jgi:hypothetical protein
VNAGRLDVERREECVKTQIRDDSAFVLPPRTRRVANVSEVDADLAGVCARCLRRGAAQEKQLCSPGRHGRGRSLQARARSGARRSPGTTV